MDENGPQNSAEGGLALLCFVMGQSSALCSHGEAVGEVLAFSSAMQKKVF